MANICEYCGLQALGLPRCAKCKQVYYCSNECQRRDWKAKHKSKCKEFQSRKENVFSQTMGRQLPMKKEKRHGNNPCSPKNQCYTDDDKNRSKTRGKCAECGKTISVTFTCRRCQKVNYCSRMCLRKNWNEHRLYCTSIEEECYEIITTEGFRREEAYASRVNRRAGFRRAESLSLKAFVMSSLVLYIRDIPRTMGFSDRHFSSGLFVGFISRMHERISKGIYLQDEVGDEVQVMFALKKDVRQANFRWNDVVPGRFLCIKGPYIEHFSKLMLVNAFSAVRVFDV